MRTVLGMYNHHHSSLIHSRLSNKNRLWVPGQLFNFYYVPVHLRVAFIVCIEFIWSVTISFVSQSGDRVKLDEQE